VLAFVARRLAPEFSGGTVSFGDAEFYNGTVYTVNFDGAKWPTAEPVPQG
jgi:hypothetical protein